jgi:predicted nucleic acid-binding protein
VAGELLLDTGALVSLLNRRQPAHESCRQVLREWRRPIVSTEAVLTEATHLLGALPGGRTACVDYFLRGAAILVPMSSSLLGRCRLLMANYADLPMDYADATLVALAEELDTDAVLTTGRRDFEVYRIGERRRFRVLPQ